MYEPSDHPKYQDFFNVLLLFLLFFHFIGWVGGGVGASVVAFVLLNDHSIEDSHPCILLIITVLVNF